VTLLGEFTTWQIGLQLSAGCAETTVKQRTFKGLGYGIWCLNFGDGDRFKSNTFTDLYKFGGAIIVSTIFGQQPGKIIDVSVTNLDPTPINLQ
jgi:hypothetical protein